MFAKSVKPSQCLIIFTKVTSFHIRNPDIVRVNGHVRVSMSYFNPGLSLLQIWVAVQRLQFSVMGVALSFLVALLSSSV